MDVWQVSRCAVMASAPCAARFGAMGSILTGLAVIVIVAFVVRSLRLGPESGSRSAPPFWPAGRAA